MTRCNSRVHTPNSHGILDSVEKMLDVYRQRCMSQAVELSALKKAMDGRDGRIQAHSSHLHEVVEDLERLIKKNEELERHVERLNQRIRVEEEWRATALAWMESDQRIHVRDTYHWQQDDYFVDVDFSVCRSMFQMYCKYHK